MIAIARNHLRANARDYPLLFAAYRSFEPGFRALRNCTYEATVTHCTAPSVPE